MDDKTILLVEDEALIALNEANLLKEYGFNVVTAYSAEKAIQTVDEKLIDLVLMDIDLGPGKMDGTEAAEIILSKRELPIVFLSSHTEPEIVQKTEKITSYGYIVKNSGDTVLLTSIKMAFRLHEAHRDRKKEREEKNFHAQMLKAVDQAIIATDLEGKIIHWNQAARELYGWSREEILGKYINDITVPEIAREQAEELMAHLTRGESWSGDFTVRHKSGRRFFAHVTNSPIVEENNRLIGIIGISFDISDRIKMEEEQERINRQLKERVKELRCLSQLSMVVETYDSLEEIATGIVSIIPEAWLYPDITCARIMLGESVYTSDSFVETEWKIREEVTIEGECIGSIEVFYTEERPERDEGPFLLEERTLLTLLAERLGKIVERNRNQEEIQEKEEKIKEERARLKEREEQYRTTLHSIGDAVIATDTNGNVVTMNGSAEQLTGFSLDRVIGRPLHDVFNIRDSNTDEPVGNPVDNVLSEGKQVTLSNHTRLLSGDGSRYQIADSAAPIKDDEGTTTGVVLVFRDVTERYEQQQRLRESQNELARNKRFLESMFDAIHDYITVQDRDLNIARVNRTVREMFNDHLPLEGKKCYEVFHGRTAPCKNCPTLRAFASKHVESEVISVSVNGQERWFELFSYPVLNDDGEVDSVVEYGRDITERKQNDEKIQGMLEEKDILLQEIHHRVKNNMTIVSGLLSLQAGMMEGEEGKTALREARDRIGSMQRLYERMYQSADYSEVDLGEYLDDIIQEIITVYGNDRITVYSRVESVKVPIKYAVPLGIILNELVTNAIKYAFPEIMRGSIDIVLTRNDEGDKGDVELSVLDDGVGFPDGFDVVTCDSFGLTVVKTLVQQLEGRMETVTEGGNGFSITFCPFGKK